MFNLNGTNANEINRKGAFAGQSGKAHTHTHTQTMWLEPKSLPTFLGANGTKVRTLGNVHP